MEIIENLDDLTDTAQSIQLNKNDYLDCLRCVTKDKILSIKEAEKLFK